MSIYQKLFVDLHSEFEFNRTMANGTIEQLLQDHGIHPTAARILVLQKLSELTHPVSMTELETELETMDKSTIFRTLNVLLEHHAIHSFEDGSGSVKYEICRCESTVCRVENRHIHFYCEECNRTFCIDDVKIPPNVPAAKPDFRHCNRIAK